MTLEDQVGPPWPAPKARVEESLREILSDSAYRDVSADSSEAEARIASAAEAMGRWFADLFQLGASYSVPSWATVAVVLAVLVGLAVLGFKLYHRDRNFHLADSPVDDPESSVRLGDLLHKAMGQALEQGLLTEALSLRFRLGLLAVAQRHPGRLRPGFTNRECLVVWKSRPDYRKRLAGVIDLLDRKWYAREECTADEFERAEAVLVEMAAYAN